VTKDYYPPQVVTVPSAPPVYIERGDLPASQELSPEAWHFCAATQGYYPNVQEYPGGWIELPLVPAALEPGYWYRCSNPPGFYPYVRQCPSGWVKTSPQKEPAAVEQ
jgi:hypothetical protein